MAPTPKFSLVRTPVANAPRLVTVIDAVDVTPTYRRIRVAGDFAEFASLGADDHLRIFFTPEGFDGEDVSAMREHPSREYTPAAWDADSLTLEFVIHGDGPATTWAREAVPGATAMIAGPRGSLVIEGRPDWWLLAGDRTALPATRRFLGQVPAGVPVDVVLIAEDPSDAQGLESAGALTATWVRSIEELVAGIVGVGPRDGDGFAFVAAEQSVVKPAREALLARGVELDRAVVKGYWKQGEADSHT